MAVNKTFDARTLILVFEDGVNARGETKFIKKSIPYIAEAVTELQLHDLGTKLSSLYNLSLSGISIDEDFVLEQVI